MSMRITQKNIRNFQVRYHRNGVTGNGFHACSFVFKDGSSFTDMLAVVFPEKGNIAVVTVDDIKARWRGDDFEQVLREAIQLVELANPSALHQHTGTDSLAAETPGKAVANV